MDLNISGYGFCGRSTAAVSVTFEEPADSAIAQPVAEVTRRTLTQLTVRFHRPELRCGDGSGRFLVL